MGIGALLIDLVPLVPLLPAVGSVILLVRLIGRPGPGEGWTATVAEGALWIASMLVGLVLVGWWLEGRMPVVVSGGQWFGTQSYGFELPFLVDGPALAMAGLVMPLLVATARFSRQYLHREPGYVRFFILMQLFSAGMLMLVLAGSLDLLFAGWEVVGMTSVLLVGFFHERNGPVRAATRVLVTYRLCDVGLLVAYTAMHRAWHSASFATLTAEAQRPQAPWVLPVVAAGLLVGVMGKSALFPFSGWLPRAMAGPTASSAVFYGSLSVHAGIFLLIRTYPIFEAQWGARLVLLAIGLATTVTCSLSARVFADAKTTLAYATAAQLGIMVILLGLGFPTLALMFLCAHALMRYSQFIRSPSTLQRLLDQDALLPPRSGQAGGGLRWLPVSLQLAIYRLALERFEQDAFFERWLGRPALRLSQRLDRWERWLLGEER